MGLEVWALVALIPVACLCGLTDDEDSAAYDVCDGNDGGYDDDDGDDDTVCHVDGHGDEVFVVEEEEEV